MAIFQAWIFQISGGKWPFSKPGFFKFRVENGHFQGLDFFKFWMENSHFPGLDFANSGWKMVTLSGLNFAWINFRDFRVFWPFSRNFVHAKYLGTADSRNKVHAKFLGICVKYRENRKSFIIL